LGHTVVKNHTINFAYARRSVKKYFIYILVTWKRYRGGHVGYT